VAAFPGDGEHRPELPGDPIRAVAPDLAAAQSRSRQLRGVPKRAMTWQPAGHVGWSQHSSLKAIRKKATIVAVILGRTSPAPGVGSPVELSCSDASSLLNLIGVGTRAISDLSALQRMG
jgi:hypothetical protein